MYEKKDVYIKLTYNIIIEGTTYLIPPNPEYGYLCGYSLFIPKGCEKDTTLIVHSCNTGGRGLKKGSTAYHLDEANEVAKISTYDLNPGIWFGSDLKMPVLIPIIPRVADYYTHALGSEVLHNDVSGLIKAQEERNDEEKLSDKEIAQIQKQCWNITEQLVNMIKSSKLFLEQLEITIDDKVITEGYSAGSKFANLFTALHPEIVKACVCGGNSGLGILPISEYKGQILNYPLGVANIPNFDAESFKKTPQLYYIGTEDYNDPAMPKCDFKTDEKGNEIKDSEGNKIPVTDEKGNIIPILDDFGHIQPRFNANYTQTEIEQIHNLLGSNPQVRFDNNQRLYNALGVNAVFRKFPGTHKTVTNNHDGEYVYTNECVKDFIRNVLKKEKEMIEESKLHM